MNTHRKGSRWRRAVEVWLQGAGFETTSRGIGFAGDDIVAVRAQLVLSIEAKNAKTIDLAGFVDQAVANANGSIPTVVVHRRGHIAVDDAYVVLPGRAFIELLGGATMTPCRTPSDPEVAASPWPSSTSAPAAPSAMPAPRPRPSARSMPAMPPPTAGGQVAAGGETP